MLTISLTVEGDLGFRVPFQLADVALDIDAENRAFSLAGEATVHVNLDDPQDPGQPGGMVVVAGACPS